MMLSLVNYTVLLLFTHYSITGAVCPQPDLIEPFTCSTSNNKDTLIFTGTDQTELNVVFKRMSKVLSAEEKHFYQFYTTNTAFKTLANNTFEDITFDSMYFYYTSGLTEIQQNAFLPHNNATVKEFNLYLATAIGLPSEFVNSFSTLVNLESIELFYVSFNKLPDYAFYNLDHLKSITISMNIDMRLSISAHSFDFRNESNQTLTITLNNVVNSTSVAVGSFTNAKRPLNINIGHNSLTYLDEKIYLPILHAANGVNVISFSFSSFLCDDCRMRWLKVDKTINVANQVKGITCVNGNNFYSLAESYFDFCL